MRGRRGNGRRVHKRMTVRRARKLLRGLAYAFDVKTPRLITKPNVVLIEDRKRILGFYERRKGVPMIVLLSGGMNKITVLHEWAHHVSKRCDHRGSFRSAVREAERYVRVCGER